MNSRRESSQQKRRQLEYTVAAKVYPTCRVVLTIGHSERLRPLPHAGEHGLSLNPERVQDTMKKIREEESRLMSISLLCLRIERTTPTFMREPPRCTSAKWCLHAPNGGCRGQYSAFAQPREYRSLTLIGKRSFAPPPNLELTSCRTLCCVGGGGRGAFPLLVLL